MEKQDILDYVSKTPENVNVNVLGGMLDEFASGGGGSVEPFFFVVEIKGIDPQSGEPIVEETSTTYNNLLSMIADGRPIYCKTIMPQELASGMQNHVESTMNLITIDHLYDSMSNEHEYMVTFSNMRFFSSAPNTMFVSEVSHGDGGDDTPTT